MTRLLTLALALTGLLIGLAPHGAVGQSGLAPQFSVNPTAPDINTETTLDAGTSQVNGSSIARYEWDLDEDGSFEIRTESPSVTHLFAESGPREVTLRITDSRNRSATTTRTVEVESAPVRVRRTIETPLGSNRVPAGSAIEVTVTIHVNERILGLGLDENVPDGWRVHPSENDGGVYKGSQHLWLWARVVEPGETLTVVYSATTSERSAGQAVGIDGTVSSQSPRMDIPIPGDGHIRVI